MGVNYRILYFFHAGVAVVLSHGITKQASEVPPREIDLAIRRKKQFAAYLDRHTYEETE